LRTVMGSIDVAYLMAANLAPQEDAIKRRGPSSG
jgi:hypothetical protein